jgi:hypothetical protein
VEVGGSSSVVFCGGSTNKFYMCFDHSPRWLALAPDWVKAFLATARMRSRFCCAAERCFRPVDGERFVAIKKILAKGDSLH